MLHFRTPYGIACRRGGVRYTYLPDDVDCPDCINAPWPAGLRTQELSD